MLWLCKSDQVLTQGCLDDAEILLVQVVNARKKLHGVSHPETLRSLRNLAWSYRHQGRDHDAKKLKDEVVKEVQDQALVPTDI